jgi:hypothetical protein
LGLPLGSFVFDLHIHNHTAPPERRTYAAVTAVATVVLAVATVALVVVTLLTARTGTSPHTPAKTERSGAGISHAHSRRGLPP